MGILPHGVGRLSSPKSHYYCSISNTIKYLFLQSRQLLLAGKSPYLLGLNEPRDELVCSRDVDQQIARQVAVEGRLDVPRHHRINSHA